MSHKSLTQLLAVDKYVAIDTETTGLDTTWCEIIELAAVKVVDGEPVESFQELVKPNELPLDEFIENLTGITAEMLEDARTIDAVLPDFIEFVGDMPVIGHNVSFDIRFINNYSQALNLGGFNPNACDTMRVSRVLYPEMDHHRLKDVVKKCESIGGSCPDFGPAHRALHDAEMTSWCYEIMRPSLTDRFGSDPEQGYRRKTHHAAYASTKEFFDGLTATTDAIDDSNPFYGCNVCFTGKLICMTRKEAWQHATNLGAIAQKSVTKKTDYLVVGSLDFSANIKGDKTAKLCRAEELFAENGSPLIVSEDFFLQFAED